MNCARGLLRYRRGHRPAAPCLAAPRLAFCAAIIIGLAACAVTPYGYVGDGYGGGYYDGIYEPYGYDYGYWGGDYRVGPPRGGEGGGFRGGPRHGGGGFGHGHGGPGGGHGGAPSIPQGARGGGGRHR
jgi:hypothetical protein